VNTHVNAIAGRLSLRPPQRRSLEILDRITEIAPPAKDADVAAALAAIRSEFPTVTDFERDFPSLCFALATGVGKTRLMGAFVSYLHMAHGIDNFFVLAPNLTIYNKLIADFTPGTPKYVFKGIAEFATHPPEIITGDNYKDRVGTLFDDLVRCKVNIFNISKINSEVRGGKSPRIKRLSEYIGQSYFEYLAGLPNLVLLMDESHRYRASAGIRAINELKPSLGLEVTATPYVETSGGPVAFKNVIFDYPLARAMADGFVKEPAVLTRKNFNPATTERGAVERMKLEDGIGLHEQTKVELETYARENDLPIVKPFVLVIARDTTHASQLIDLMKSREFFDGRYADRVLQVDSSRSGAEEDAMVASLLGVEQADNPIEIVVHVNMLKEGWDVTNLYTIIPLRAANARVLIEQSIGRGLRLPYGKRTGVASVDRLNIVAHDRFQEIVDEANRPDSIVRMQTLELDESEFRRQPRTIVAQSVLASMLGFAPASPSATTEVATGGVESIFTSPEEKAVAEIVYRAIQKMQRNTAEVPGVSYLRDEAVQAYILREVTENYRPQQGALEGIGDTPDIAAVVAKTTEAVIQQTIDIPRIIVVPKAEVRSGFRPFTVDVSGIGYQAPSEDLFLQYLRTGETVTIGIGGGVQREARLEDHILRRLVDFNDVAYDSHADLLYDLAGQVVTHLCSYLPEEDVRRVLVVHGREIGNLVHAQMQSHYWEDDVEFDVEVRAGFTEIRQSSYTQSDETLDFRVSPVDKSNMAKYLFGGFTRCLHPVAKFQSEQERILAVVLERESERWFRPARGQFQIYYRSGPEHLEYQPDFVAETAHAVYMLESKARNQLDAADVLAKKAAAVLWCERASAHTATCGGKPWRYALIPHDRIAVNMTIAGLVSVAG
jgi:type III restriction enzyme